ncbi:MAG: DUF1501 domain-containing protein [Pirellulaceae bacterium]|nr:DUF1501 domain-containing protein [Pirellulaceae bacterium]
MTYNSECESWHRMQRRQWLSHSMLSIGGLGLTAIAESLARASESPREDRRGQKSRKARSLIVLWLQGGPSQLDTFDPHVGTLIGGDVQSIRTSIPEIEISDSLPLTAEQLHLTTLVRSLVSKEGDHERATYQLKTGWRPDPTIVHPSLGAILCHQTEDNLEIPRHISILNAQWPARGGYLGGQYDAFQVDDPNNRLPNLRRPTSEPRMRVRIDGLKNVVEREFARGRFQDLDILKTQHESATAKALQMMDSQQVAAFDISQEPESKHERFGNSSFGRGCLAAIRLIEQGVRCVEIQLSGWDSHVNNQETQSERCVILDKALSALLQELKDRELLDSTIVVCGGEFGRSPNINGVGGRDHWQHGFSTLLAGGPLRRGYVHGATASKPTSDPAKRLDDVRQPITVQDLHATLLDSLDIDFSQELKTPIGRPLLISEGRVVRELLG